MASLSCTHPCAVSDRLSFSLSLFLQAAQAKALEAKKEAEAAATIKKADAAAEAAKAVKGAKGGDGAKEKEKISFSEAERAQWEAAGVRAFLAEFGFAEFVEGFAEFGVEQVRRGNADLLLLCAMRDVFSTLDRHVPTEGSCSY